MRKHTGLRLALAVALVTGADLGTKAGAPALAERTPLVMPPVGNSALSLQLVDMAHGTEVAVMAGLLLGLTILGRRLVVRRLVPVWAAALVLGGSLGNLLDRAVLGAVRDFLPIGHVVLNLADLAVAAGLAVTVVCLWPRQHHDSAARGGVNRPHLEPPLTVARG